MAVVRGNHDNKGLSTGFFTGFADHFGPPSTYPSTFLFGPSAPLYTCDPTTQFEGGFPCNGLLFTACKPDVGHIWKYELSPDPENPLPVFIAGLPDRADLCPAMVDWFKAMLNESRA